jgi:hypothetical protein
VNDCDVDSLQFVVCTQGWLTSAGSVPGSHIFIDYSGNVFD